MMERARSSRPPPAIVVAIMALVAAVAGTAVADPVANTAISKKKVKKIAKKEAKKYFNANIGNASVAHAETARNADELGGVPGSGYVRRSQVAAGAWHEVGAAGEPGFNATTACRWVNFDAFHNSAAFVRDRLGFVHLRGMVRARTGNGGICPVDPISFVGFANAADRRIFVLPPGYRPARREVNATLTGGALGRVNVDGPALASQPAGSVSTESPTTPGSAWNFLSLDGITFRCAPSGSNGCP
jgi:hypothetical protein